MEDFELKLNSIYDIITERGNKFLNKDERKRLSEKRKPEKNSSELKNETKEHSNESKEQTESIEKEIIDSNQLESEFKTKKIKFEKSNELKPEILNKTNDIKSTTNKFATITPMEKNDKNGDYLYQTSKLTKLSEENGVNEVSKNEDKKDFIENESEEKDNEEKDEIDTELNTIFKQIEENEDENEHNAEFKEKNEVISKTDSSETKQIDSVKNSKPNDTQKGPKVKIVNGEIVIDEESLFYQSKKKKREEFKIMSVEESNDILKQGKKKHFSKRWTAKEEENFFKTLRLFGTNFSMIAKMFPGRVRKDIKNKFKKEDRLNKDKIDFALQNPLPINKESMEKFLKDENK